MSMTEKLVDILNQHCDYAGHVDCKEDCTECLAKHLIANGVTVQEPEQRWISVKDRLPDSFKPVIVCREKAKGEFIVEQGHRDVNGWWKVYGTRTKSVTHWMPLPEPPKELIDETILQQDELLKRRDALKEMKINDEGITGK